MESHGVDVSSIGQGAFDWSVVANAGCIRFGGARLGSGPYSAPTHPTSIAEWDPATNPLIVHPGFIDSQASANRAGMLAVGIGWRCWYYLVTPLESAADAAARVMGWLAQNGGFPAGECVALDVESNPWKTDEVPGMDLVMEVWSLLDGAFPGRIGNYGSRGVLAQLPDWRGWRWLASYTDDALAAAAEFRAAVVQWTSSAHLSGWPGSLDMNQVVDQGALDRACGIPEVVMTVQGSLDVVEGRPGAVYVSGWAHDPDNPTAGVTLNVGGTVRVVALTFAREDVNTALALPAGTLTGFTETLILDQVPVAVDLPAVPGQARTVSVPLTPDTTVPPPVDPPVDPPVGSVDDAHIEAIARTVAREEIAGAHLTPGG